MRVIACDATTLDLEMPPCGAVDPAAYSATLTRSLCTPHTLAVAYIAPTPTSPALLRLTLPAVALRRGVWALSVNTPCGCRKTALFFDGCAPPGLVGEHLPTRDLPTPTPVSCAPALQPDLTLPNPVLGFDFARSVDGLATGIDTEPLVPYGVALPPAPVYTSVVLGTTEAQPLLLEGEFAPAPAGLNGTTWTLLDRYGRELATGVLAVAAGVATLTATLATPLWCGAHYLTLEESPP